MIIRTGVSTRAIVCILAILLLLSAASVAFVKNADAALLDTVTDIAGSIASPVRSLGTNTRTKQKKALADSAYGDNGDRIIVGKGDQPLSDGTRTDRIQVIEPSGTPSVLSALRDFEPSLSPDGKQIVYVSVRGTAPTTSQFTLRTYQQLFIMNADGSDQRMLRSIAPGGKAQPSFSPDGQKIVFVSGDNNIWVRDLATGSESILNTTGCTVSATAESGTKKELPQNGAFPGVFGPDTPNYSPDGNYIIFSRNNSGRKLWRVDANGTGSCVMLFNEGPDSRAMTASYSPDGTKIAVRTYAANPNEEWYNDLAIIDSTTGAILAQYAPPNFYQHPTWSPDGGTIAYPAADVNFDEFNLYVGRAVRIFNLQTQQMDEIYVSGSPEGIHGMTWGTPTTEVPAISLRINSPHPLTSGLSTTGTINLEDPAPVGGRAVTFSIVNGDVSAITLPNTLITVPEGETQATFTIDSPINTTFRNTDIVATAAVGTAQATVSLVPTRPDLEAVSFTVPATPVPAASPIPVSWTVTNVGSVTTGTNGGTDLVYFSVDAVWDTIDQQIQSVSNVELLPGNSRNRNSTATIPANRVPTSGQYYLILCANPFGDQPIEANLANNCIAQPIQVNIADLVIQNLVVPANSEPNVAYTLTWDVRNTGGVSAPTSNTQVFFSIDSVAGNADDLFFASVSTAAIAPNGVISQSRSVTIPTTPLRPDGTSFFYVKADTSNTVPEGTTTGAGETNNTNFQPTQFVYRVPDMQVTASSVAADVDTDTAFPLSWTTTNAGNKATTANLVDRVWLSADQTVGSDVNLGTFTLTGGLANGASADRIQNITIPYANVPASGTYYLLIQTDQSGLVDEGVYEGNNVRIQPIYVRKALRPDLVVTNVTGPPTVFFDQTIQVQWTVTNNGTGPTNAPQWKDTVYLSTSSTSTSGASTLVAANSITALNPGESYTASATVKVPRGLSGGYHFIVKANSNGAVNETSSANNQLSSPVTVNVPPLPDLVVASVDAPDQVFAGTPISIQYSIRNIGTNEAGGRKDRIYLSRNTTLETSQDKLIFTSDWIYGPQAGEITSHTSQNRVGTQNPPVYQNAYLPSNLEGDWYVIVLADYQNSVYEYTGESNNTGFDTVEPGSPMNILVTPPDLVVPTQPTAPTTVATGQSFAVDFVVRNQGAFNAAPFLYHGVYLSTDQTFSPGTDTLLGSFRDPVFFAPGAEHTITLNTSLQACLPNGTYYLFAVADYNNLQFEFDTLFDAEANNASPFRELQVLTVPPDLQVSSLSHSPVTMPGESVTVNWTVANTGGNASGNWTDRIYLVSTNPEIGTVTLASVNHTGGLFGGGSYSETRTVVMPSYMQGDYYIVVTTDAGTSVPECGTSENNNGAQGSNFSVTNNLPDLVVDAVTAPSSATVGDTFQVQWTGRNANQQMPANSPSWRDYVYLSSDPNLSNNDIYLGGALNSSILGSGQTYPQQTSVTIGNVTPGTYYVLVYGDGSKNIYEGSPSSGFESNNVRASAPITLSVPAVDLTVGGISISTPHYSGTFRTVSWTVTNNGSSPTLTDAWTDYIYLSRDSILDPSDTQLGYRGRTGVLAGGVNYAQSTSVFIPVGLTGSYTIFVVTDKNNSVVENNNSNNTSSPLAISLSVPPPAEMGITNIVPPASIPVGGSAVFTWTVQNTGANPVEGRWRDTIYLSRDQFWDASDILMGIRDLNSETTSLPSGGTYTTSYGGETPPVEEGTYYVIVRTDAQDRIRESNEANNVATSVGTTTVTIPTLQLNTPFNTTLGNGSSLFFKYVTEPAETLVFSLDTDTPQRSNEAFTKFGTMVSRADYDFQSQRPGEGDQVNVIDSTQEGQYYSMVRTDLIPGSFAESFDKSPARSVGEQPAGSIPPQNITVNARILPFSIRQVSPTIGGNQGDITLLIDGAKFQQGATVKLVGSGNQQLTPRLTQVSQSKIAAIFDLKGKPLGDYDVVVTNPDDETTQLDDGFELVEGTSGGHSIGQNILGPTALRSGFSHRPRYTFTAKNDGLNDAYAVPVVISFPRTVGWTLDRTNYFDLPAEYLPSNAVLPLELVTEFENRRYMFLIIPILKSRSSVNINLELSYPGSGGLDVGFAVLPPILDILRSGPPNDPQGFGPSKFKNDFIGPLGATAGEIAVCYLEGLRALTFALLNLVPGASCVDDALQVMVPFVDILSGIALGASTGTIGEQGLVTSAGGFLISCVKNAIDCLGGEIPWIKYLDVAYSMFFAIKQLVDCTNKWLFMVVDFFFASDPNDKIAPRGYGAERFVPVRQPMLYQIRFENIAAATAPAARITITDVLPPTLDPRTVRLKEIVFKQTRIVIPDNQAFYQNRVQLGADLNNLQADILAGLDLVNNRIFWTLQAIDPQTGDAPVDPLLGILPPNNANQDGEGYVLFTIEPTATMPTGTVINNSASIVFDANEPIITNVTENQLDSGIPITQMSALPATSETPVIDLSWSGIDDATGSGLSGFDIFSSESGASYLPIFNNTTETGGTLAVKWGKTYRFYSLGRDNAGNVERAPAQPDATIRILGGDTEGDVAPRPNGSDGSVNGDDLTQVRRFIAKLDSALQYNEFQRADMAPKADGGDGSLSVADVMQARRYVAGTDPIAGAAGPNELLSLAPKAIAGKNSNLLPREVKPITIIRHGNQIEVGIVLETQGDETGLGFGLIFDPAVLSNPVVNLRPIASGGTLTLNTAQVATGKLGVMLDKAPNQPFAAGSNVLMTIMFDIANGSPATTQISFDDDPIKREVVDGLANGLNTTFSPGTIQLLGPTAANVSVSGRVLKADGTPIKGARLILFGSQTGRSSTISNAFGYFTFIDVVVGQTYTMNVSARGYTFTPQSIMVTDEISGLEITPDP